MGCARIAGTYTAATRNRNRKKRAAPSSRPRSAVDRPKTDPAPEGLTEAGHASAGSNGHGIAAALPAWLRERFSGSPVHAKKRECRPTGNLSLRIQLHAVCVR